MALSAEASRGLPSPGLTGTLLSQFDATYQWTTLAPNYSRMLKAKYGDQGYSLFLMFYNLGMKEAVQTPKGSTWEKGFIKALFSSSASAGPYTAGQTATVILAASEIDADGYSYPLVGDVWMHMETGVQGLILTNSAGTLTIKPLLSTEAWGTIEAGDTFIKIGTAFAEGTDHPIGRQNYWYKYYWQTQIFKTTYALSGTQLTNQPQWNRLDYVDNNGGIAGYDFWTEGTTDAEYQMMSDFAYTFFFGKTATNTSIPRTSTGLDYEITQRGINYAAGNTFDRTDLQLIGEELSQVWGGNTYLALMNLNDYQSLNSDILTDLANTNIALTTQAQVSDMFYGGDMAKTQSLTSTFDWNAVIIDGFTYFIKRNRIMDDPKGAGASASTSFQDSGFMTRKNYIVPMNKTTDRNGSTADHISFKYASRNGYNRLMEITENGRAATVPVGRTDFREYLLSAEAGWSFSCLEHFVLTNSGSST